MKKLISSLFKVLYTGIFLMSCNNAFAVIKLPAIFGTNMVLQRDIKIPIWGKADAGEKVTINFKGGTYKTTTGTDGTWFLKLGSYLAGGPYEMTIKGNDNNSLVFKNILIGDVWVASGQSNMEFGIQTEKHGPDSIKTAKDSFIHFFFVPFASSLHPQNDIADVGEGSSNGKWVVCSPQMMGDPKWAWHGFSAVGYYFSQQIRRSAHCPVGMIACYKGGTAAQAWISVDGLKENPSFNNYVLTQQNLSDHYEEAKAAYPKQMADYQSAMKQWNEEAGKDYDAAVKQWEIATTQAKANGTSLPVHPKPSRPMPKTPTPPDGGFNSPSNLYNAMVMPILHYGIKGVIWYQGESNGDRLDDAVAYKELFPRLINNWRNNWGQGTFPFLFVQLPNFRTPALTPSQDNWPWVREAQAKTLSLPQTGMCTIIDIGDADNIHPVNKLDVGYRLALVARHLVYHENILYSGPQYERMKIEGNSIKLIFDKKSPLIISNNSPELKGFGVAGADHKFYWAKAVIKDNTITVSSDDVSSPVAVRYDWADNPSGNLYNQAGLPASPFRTDNWDAPLPITK